MKFDLLDGWYLRKLDNNNIVLARQVKAKNGNLYEKTEGFYSSWQNAYILGALKKLPMLATSKKEIRFIVKSLEELKNDFTTWLGKNQEKLDKVT